jgi:hypothetical protein
MAAAAAEEAGDLHAAVRRTRRQVALDRLARDLGVEPSGHATVALDRTT